MDFSFSAHQIAEFATILEGTAKLSKPCGAADFDRSAWLELGRLGLLGANLPSSHRGRGWGALDSSRAFEAAGQGCTNTGLIFAAAAHVFACATPLLEFGNQHQKDSYLSGMALGHIIGANAITEADAGSDVGALRTRATSVNGGYMLNGVKSFVSNAPVADVIITYAVTDPKAGPLGRSAFVVPSTRPGVNIGAPLEKAGLDGCVGAPVEFDECFVPNDHVLGVPGQGGAIFQASMLWERTCLFAMYVGMQQRLLDQCVNHTRTRRQFGQRLSKFQAVSHRIVDMKLSLESARQLLYRASWGIDNDDDPTLFSALSKLAISEAAIVNSVAAMELFGGRGYLKETEIESALRDAMGSIIFSGTSNIQRELIARELRL
jgi:alkylation response protein AidB-like acyl-CoA dehydrogenase